MKHEEWRSLSQVRRQRRQRAALHRIEEARQKAAAMIVTPAEVDRKPLPDSANATN